LRVFDFNVQPTAAFASFHAAPQRTMTLQRMARIRLSLP
jgi:hypothetical protein